MKTGFCFLFAAARTISVQMDVGLDRADGAVDDELDADCGGEVEDDVGLVDELGDGGTRTRRTRWCTRTSGCP